MRQTNKRNYDRYTFTFRLQAITLANHPDIKSKDVAESLGALLVMLCRWQKQHRDGQLK